MDVVPYDAFFKHVCAYILHVQDYIVDGSAFRGEFAVDRECSCLFDTIVSSEWKPEKTATCNIRSIAIKLRARINQEIQLPLHIRAIRLIMQRRCRSSTRENPMVSLLPRSIRNALLNENAF